MINPELDVPSPQAGHGGNEPARARVTLVSDDPWWAGSIKSVIAEELEVEISAPERATERVRKLKPDFVLVHVRHSGSEGPEMVRALSIPVVGSSAPVLLISDRALTREERLAALRAGAWDCLHAPLDAEELALKLDFLLAQKRSAALSGELSLLDPLTGLYNAQGIVRSLAELVSASQRYGRPLGCAIFSVASPGYAADPTAGTTGEGSDGYSPKVIPFARMIAARRRASDIVGRLSGQEVVVLAPETTLEGTTAMARRLLEAGRRELESDEVTTELHAGCYSLLDRTAGKVEPLQVIHGARVALRLAQQGPSGGVELYTSEPPN